MIYVTSDIHGCVERYRSLMSKIDLKTDDTLYILGDVVDRYPGGIELLLEIMEAENIKMLLGNHEYMMLCVLRPDPEESDWDKVDNICLWHNNGGQVTHDAFNAQPRETRERILNYLRSLPLNIDVTVNDKRYKLVHGDSVTKYPNFKSKNKSGNPYLNKAEYAVWHRWNIGDSKPRGYTMIFGHTPTIYYRPDIPMKIYKNGSVIGIDCGCGYRMKDKTCPRLACLRLDDMAEFYSDIM